MNTKAELTLQVVRRVQENARPDLPEFPGRWVIWPGGERVDWEGARSLLERQPKPVLVSPLLEPGMLGLWTLDSLAAERREVARRGIASQVQYYADKLTAIGVAHGPVRFGSAASSHELTRDDFLRWATEYAINVGISLEPAEGGAVARVRVLSSLGGTPLTL